MKKLTKNKPITFATVGLIILVMAILTAFCFVAEYSLIIALLLFIMGLHLYFLDKASVKLFLQLGLLLALILFTADALTEYTMIPRYYIPVAGIGMLVVLLYNDLQLVFLMSFVSSVIVGLMVGNDLKLMLIFFIGSLTAAYTVKDARTRGELIQAGFFVGLIQVLAAVLLNPVAEFILSKAFWVHHIKPFLINGFVATGVVMVTLKVFEYLFGVLTNFSLLELSDFNQPLLRRMIVEAPGTYHHSLIVSNLSETAAEAIGANSLLTRVGAYYHDIGKLIKPEYFTENQMLGGNKHDHIEPSISKLVILNHVKDGLEIAKKYKLNPIITKFIPEHHGTGIIYYFYQKALVGAQGEAIDEQHYRYPGPKPQSRETAITLLADSVEGAVRALEDPTAPRIDETVRKVINNKFIDGQLDECNLTLKEIETISATFSRVLSAMYHSRIKYPDKRDEDTDNHKKPSEKNSSFSPPNHKNGKNHSSS